MTKRRMTKQERQIRIELARTRAALERQNVARSLHDLHESLTPSGIFQSLFSRSGGRGHSGGQVNWLAQAVALSRRYPFLITGASAALSTLGRGRRGVAWRLVLGALAGWRLLRRVQRQVPDIHPDTGPVTRPAAPRAPRSG